MMRSTLLRLAFVAGVALAGSACSDPEAAKRAYLANGDRYAAEGKTGEAIVEYRNAVRTDPRYGEARWRLAEAYARAQNAQGAYREYIRAADLLPDNVDAQVKAATYLLMARRFEDAKARSERALQRDPNNVEALIVRANATAGLKDVPGAIRDIEEALKTQPADGRIYSSLGALRFVEGQRVEAEAAFKKALEISPKSIEARLAMANFYWATGRAAEVEQTLNEARALDPAHLMVNRMLAALYLATRRAPEAEAPLKAVAERTGDVPSTLALADYYIQTQRPVDASTVLKPLAENSASSGAATLRLALIERHGGRHDAAYRMIDELIKKEPKNTTALAVVSGWQLRDREFTDALKTARAAVEADPASAPAQFALGQALVELRQPDDAIKALNEVLRLNPRVVAAQVILSRLQLEQGNANAAVQFASEAKKAAPANPNVQLALAKSLVIQGNLTQAAPEVRALLERYPQVAASHTVNGMLLLRSKNLPGARAAFMRALELDPASAEALEGLLALDVASNNVAAAVARIEERVGNNPQSVPLMSIAARTYAVARQPEKTEKALRSVLQLDPDNLGAYLLLGRTYASQRRLDEALVEFDAAAKRNPNHVGAATMAAMIVQLQNKEPEAQKRYEAIVAASQHAPVAANNLAWIYAERGGNLDVALQLAQSAKSQLPDVAEVNDTLGWIYYKRDLPLMAIPFLEESALKDPKNAMYHLHLGLTYAKAGQKDKARAALESALKLQPNLPEAAEARRLLTTM